MNLAYQFNMSMLELIIWLNRIQLTRILDYPFRLKIASMFTDIHEINLQQFLAKKGKYA